MDKVFFALALLSMVGVVFSLFRGLLALGGGTQKDHQISQKMMQWRVKFQGTAIIFLLLAYLAKH